MSYVQKTLLSEEKILYYTKPHYIIFYPVFLWLVLAAWFLNTSNAPVLFGPLLLLMTLFSCINEFFNYRYSEYAITDKRIIMKIGFIRRKSLELFLDRIESIYVDQSVVGRIFDFGTVTVCGTGGTKDPFYYIPNPIAFRNSVQQQIQTITKH